MKGGADIKSANRFRRVPGFGDAAGGPFVDFAYEYFSEEREVSPRFRSAINLQPFTVFSIVATTAALYESRRSRMPRPCVPGFTA